MHAKRAWHDSVDVLDWLDFYFADRLNNRLATLPPEELLISRNQG